EVLRRRIALARESKDLAALPMADLRDDVGCSAKSINADRFGISGGGKRAPADQPRAHQGCGRNRVGEFAEIKRVRRVGDHVRGKATIACVTGELRKIAEVLAIRKAVRTVSACVSEPRHAGALAG